MTSYRVEQKEDEYQTDSLDVCELLTGWRGKVWTGKKTSGPLTAPVVPAVPDVQIGFGTIKIQQDTFPNIILNLS